MESDFAKAFECRQSLIGRALLHVASATMARKIRVVATNRERQEVLTSIDFPQLNGSVCLHNRCACSASLLHR